jgi:hypothetical protein
MLLTKYWEGERKECNFLMRKEQWRIIPGRGKKPGL